MKWFLGAIGAVALAITIFNAGRGSYDVTVPDPARSSSAQTPPTSPAPIPAAQNPISESAAFTSAKKRALGEWGRDWQRVIEITSEVLADTQLAHSERATLLIYRARAYEKIEKREQAIADYQAAAEQDGAPGYAALAVFHFESGDYSAADRAYRLAVAAKGTQMNELGVLGSYAWFLAVCPDEMFRDSLRALALAEHGFTAIQSINNPEATVVHLVSLSEAAAAAHAEQGNFAEASKMEQGLDELKAKLGIFIVLRPGHSERLAAYKAGKPWYLPLKK